MKCVGLVFFKLVPKPVNWFLTKYGEILGIIYSSAFSAPISILQ